jgi:hypothetical protein
MLCFCFIFTTGIVFDLERFVAVVSDSKLNFRFFMTRIWAPGAGARRPSKARTAFSGLSQLLFALLLLLKRLPQTKTRNARLWSIDPFKAKALAAILTFYESMILHCDESIQIILKHIHHIAYIYTCICIRTRSNTYPNPFAKWLSLSRTIRTDSTADFPSSSSDVSSNLDSK